MSCHILGCSLQSLRVTWGTLGVSWEMLLLFHWVLWVLQLSWMPCGSQPQVAMGVRGGCQPHAGGLCWDGVWLWPAVRVPAGDARLWLLGLDTHTQVQACS